MAAITTGVAYRVTNLAGEVIDVHLVHLDLIFGFTYRCVAIGAVRQLGAIISVSWFATFWSRIIAVHLRSGVAIDTVHPPLAKMDIRPDILVLTKVFIPNPAAVTGCAVARHGWRLVEYMTFDQASTH